MERLSKKEEELMDTDNSGMIAVMRGGDVEEGIAGKNNNGKNTIKLLYCLKKKSEHSFISFL